VTVEVDQMLSERPRYVYFALIASLAMNLLFVGGFAAAAWHLHHEMEEPKAPGLLSFIAGLPADRKAPLQKEILAAREAQKDLRANVRQSWLDANALLTVEPFDKAKFSAALAQLKDVEAHYRASIYNMVSDTAGMLTPDERKQLQKWRADRRAKFLNPPSGPDKPDVKDENGKPLTD
jgi:uncharacterized membrane protein